MSELEPTRTYSNPTATEVLRRMLDERGGFRVDFDREGARRTCWKNDDEQDGYCYFDEDAFGATQLTVTRITPEQAIAATLGSSKCSNNCTNSERTETCQMEYVSDWMSWHCKACDHMDMAPRNPKPRYCKWCGRKVVEPTTNDVDAEVEQ